MRPIHTPLHRQPDRKVTWYWDPDGNNGKSFLADWLEVWRGAYIVTGGRYTDIAYTFNLEDYVVFDYARDMEDKFPYKLLEDFKNTRVHSTKYVPVVKRAKACKLIVFTNFEPDKTKLSADRWDVHKVPAIAPLFRAFDGSH